MLENENVIRENGMPAGSEPVRKDAVPELAMRVIALVICSVLCWVVTERLNQGLRYDAANYWNVGVDMLTNGFIASTQAWRGYVFPVFLGICDRIGGETAWKIINAILVGCVFGVLLPYLCPGENTRNERTYLLRLCVFLMRTVLCFLLYLFFQYGTCIYPLSDFPALALCLLSCACLKRTLETRSMSRKVLWAFVCGLTVYAAYNVRTIYLFSGIVVMLAFLYFHFKRGTETGKNFKSALISTLGFVVGFFLSAIPQMILNLRVHDQFSMKIMTEDAVSNGLFKTQLLWGLSIQRYDTNISSAVQGAQIFFDDAVGAHIVQCEGLTANLEFLDYAKLLLKYPAEMVGIYARHLLNMLLPFDPEAYLNHWNRPLIVGVLLFAVLAVLFGMSWRYRDTNRKAILPFLPALVSTVTIVPGAVEQRFSISLYLCVLALLCHSTNLGSAAAHVRRSWKLYAGVFLLVLILLCTIWTSTLSCLRLGLPVFLEMGLAG